MAFPVILVDSNDGAASDTACSGAGPSTALTGSAASTDGGGTTVTLDAGTNTTNVATDGSHVILLRDTTAGHRQFAKITSKAGSGGATPTVGVAEAFTGSLSGKSWAIGGVRATAFGSVSLLLVDNNGSSGDAMPGWTIQPALSHTETVSATVNFRRAGDTTSGPIIFGRTSAGGTLPLFTFSNNGDAIIPRAASTWFKNFEMRNSNATKTASRAFVIRGNALLFQGVKISHSTDKFWKGLVADSTTDATTVRYCNFGYMANVGLAFGDGGTIMGSTRLFYNFIHDCGSGGVAFIAGTPFLSTQIVGNVLYNITGIGISYDNARSDAYGGTYLANNTVDTCSSDGFKFVTAANNVQGLSVLNNIASNNGGYGFNFSAAGFTAAYRDGQDLIIDGNDTYNNTSGAYNPSSYGSNDPATNPSYTNASGGDFSIGSALKGLGVPIGGTLPIGSTSSTYTYEDPGAAQRQETSGGSGGTAVAIFGG